ncbi:MAG: LytTR family transcriptional regulator DNA-binding domain-containing protein [Carnobacterium sp.]|uniref:LytTR family transcriptional regulator DNA-binding domain-containing protein n=1 Tax=Carnobacterium sp. TaxID=48221 RepID=UPI00257DB984|nr:LytTR family transcriptional regulator DNA-binding domain-containing protein [Carnobacterium sp.]MBQ6484945.1 LytTR family transcriptional regulator DNA-binding domain-containing protein [Carnobacterium sp.]
MKRLIVEEVMKQEKAKLLLKNISFDVEEAEVVGIKCSIDESHLLFDLIEGEKIPTSGKIQRQLTSMESDRKNDGLYEKLTVEKYLTFFNRLNGQKIDLANLKESFALIDCWKTAIEKLSLAQKKRVGLLRIYSAQPDLVLIESPLTDLDNEGIELYIKCLEIFKKEAIAVLVTAPYLEELILLSSKVYVKHESGLNQVDLSEEKGNHEPAYSANLQPNVFKILCKIDDKMIFFSPTEIDYIESINGVSQVHVGGESFPSALTMTELEARLIKFGFFRCHRSYLVNLQRVRELVSYSRNSFTLVLADEIKTKLPLSRTRLEELELLLEI